MSDDPFGIDDTSRTDVIKDEIIVREHGICCRCGNRAATDAHHRKLRSQGGLNTWDNQVGICRTCHNSIHANPALSYEWGWLVYSWDTPSTVPITYHARGRVLLGTDATIIEVTT